MWRRKRSGRENAGECVLSVDRQWHSMLLACMQLSCIFDQFPQNQVSKGRARSRIHMVLLSVTTWENKGEKGEKLSPERKDEYLRMSTLIPSKIIYHVDKIKPK